MPVPETIDPGLLSATSTPDTQTGAGSSGGSATVQLPFDPNVFFALMKVFSVTSIIVNDTFTTPTLDANFHLITNSACFSRPTTEVHYFFLAEFLFQATTGGSAPTAPLVVNFQTFLDQSHIFISPTGLGNDWTFSFETTYTNATLNKVETVMGAFFNVQFLQLGQNTPTQPDFHVIDFRYNVPSLPTGWSTLQFKPRMVWVFTIPTTAINFTNVAAPGS